MSWGWRIEAEYEDGYVLREQDEDQNPYGGGNTYTAVLNHQPTAAGHGRLVRWATFPEEGGQGLEIDWKDLPDTAEPVQYRNMKAETIPGLGQSIECMAFFFGYRIRDAEGNVIEEEIAQVH